MPTNVLATTDSPQVTVAMMIKDPLYVPTLILTDAPYLFVAEQILRAAGKPEGGVVGYYESTPLFANTNSEYVEEFGDIPLAQGAIGNPKFVKARKRALGVGISQEMQDRNNVDLVNVQVTQVRETLKQDFDGVFFSQLLAAAGNTMAATTGWSSASSKIRKDILNARKLILDQKRGFIPDTLVINPSDVINLMISTEITNIFQGNIADKNPLYSGSLNFGFSGLDILPTYSMPVGTAAVLQSKRVGGYADERPLQATPLYKWKPNAETWRSDVLRTTAVFIDQPLAAALITGI